MSAFISARCLCVLLLGLLVLCGGLFVAGVAGATEPTVSSGPFLQANFILDYAADRGHMIQITCVVVALGCAAVWWMK